MPNCTQEGPETNTTFQAVYKGGDTKRGGGAGKSCLNHPPSRIQNSYTQPDISCLQHLPFPIREEECSEKIG